VPESVTAAVAAAPRISAAIIDLYLARDAQPKTGQPFYVHYRIGADSWPGCCVATP
jgi:hypothetical protein